MIANPEVIEKPLTYEELSERFRELCVDPRFSNLPGKVEIDNWGRLLMSPASNYHGVLQARLIQRLLPLGGQAIAEASVVTTAGLLVADIAWASAQFLQAHGTETPFTRGPELCIEVVSPSNSIKELREKVEAYLAAGAVETWLVFPQTRRFEFFGKSGPLERSAFGIDLSGLFE